MTDFMIKAGNLLPDLTGGFLNEVTGAPQDLTGATLTFHMRNRAGTVVINRAAAIDGDPTLGRFRFVWEAGETDTPGHYEGEVKALINLKPITAPNHGNFTIYIAPAIA